MTGAGDATRKRIVEAAIETLKEEGFAGTSARAVAKRGGFNQALVFYHFGAMSELLLAALDETSERRMARYREALEGVNDLGRLVELAGRIYREDLDAGHMTVLAEIIAGASAVPEVGPEVVARLEPWIELTSPNSVPPAWIESPPVPALIVVDSVAGVSSTAKALAPLPPSRVRFSTPE